MDLKENDKVMFSNFVITGSNEIVKTYTTNSSRLLKSSWKRWVAEVAEESGIDLDFTREKRFIVENCLNKLEGVQNERPSPPALSVDLNLFKVPSPVASSSAKSSIKSSTKSSRSSLGIQLTELEKEQIINSYDSINVSDLWKLSSGRYLEHATKILCQKSNYLQ